MGIEETRHAFVHYPAGTFPVQDEALNDDTYFNNYGAYQLAKCMVEGIKTNHLELTKYLLDDLSTFRPQYPDPLYSWELPISPMISN